MTQVLRYIVIGLLLIAVFGSRAMIFGYGANFSVNSQKGCGPFTVVITDLSGAPDTIPVNYSWGDGSPLDSDTIHTYTEPGVYRIIQTVANGTPLQMDMYIEVVDSPEPQFAVYRCKNRSGVVHLENNAYDSYYIDWGNGNNQTGLPDEWVQHTYGSTSSFNILIKGLANETQGINDSSNMHCAYDITSFTPSVNIDPAVINRISVDNETGSAWLEYVLTPNTGYTIEINDPRTPGYTVLDTIDQGSDPDSYLIGNLNTTDTHYCFQINAFDPCDGTKILSNTGCSIQLDVVAENNQNHLTWETSSTNFLNYQVLRNGSSYATLAIENQKQYIDTDVTCGIDYPYQLIMEESGFISISDTISVTAISTNVPDAITDINASIEDQNVLLTWTEPTAFTAEGYIVERSTDGVRFTVLDTIPDLSYTDTGLFPQSTRYYYKINYFDMCDLHSEESIIASPSLLTINQSGLVSWTGYQGWTSGVNAYRLEKYDPEGNLIQTVPMGSATTYQENIDSNPYQNIQYIVNASPNDPQNSVVYSNVAEIIFRSNVMFPNAFTPNGDGLNDIFVIESQYIQQINMRIFNRWGELIFQTEELDEGWDGTIRGEPAPMATYLYIVQLTDEMGISFVKKGELVLLR